MGDQAQPFPLEVTAARGGPTSEQKNRARRTEQQRETAMSWLQPPATLPVASLKALSVTCGNNKQGGEASGLKLSLGKDEEKLFSLSV